MWIYMFTFLSKFAIGVSMVKRQLGQRYSLIGLIKYIPLFQTQGDVIEIASAVSGFRILKANEPF